MKISKRFILLFIITVLFCVSANARGNRHKDELESEDTEIPIVFKQSAQMDLMFNTMQGYEPGLFAVSGIYDVEGKRFSALAGIKLQGGDSQFTFSGAYTFFKRNKLSLGTGVIYNLNWLHDISLTNNFLPGIYLEWKPTPFYALEMNVDFFLKLRNVFILKDDLSSLINATMAFYFHNDFFLPNNINLYFEFASIEPFRYMILCAPSFIFGGRYSIENNLDVGLEIIVHYIDFFTLSAHFDDMEFHVGVGYKW